MYRRRKLLLNAFWIADVAVVAVAFGVALVNVSWLTSPGAVAWFLSYRVRLANLMFGLGFALLWHVICKSQGLYRSHRMSGGQAECLDVAKAVTLGTAAMAVSGVIFDFSAVDRSFLITFFLSALPLMLAMRVCLRCVLGGARRSGRNLRNLVIIGCGPRGEAFGKQVRSRPELGYLLVGFIDDIPPPINVQSCGHEKLLGSIDDIETIFAEMELDEVYVALPQRSNYDTIARIITASEETGILVRLPAEAFELRLAQASIDRFDGKSCLTLQTPRPAEAGLALKRAIDLVCSATALVILAPVFVVVAAAIKLESEGPVLFRQERVGLGRRKFPMLKFRSMKIGSGAPSLELELRNEVAGAAFKIKDDPRVTRVGRFIRRYSIDELPQFLNVLRGDMSIVGPRPLPVRDVERLDHRWHTRRFSVKPGITCLWQVSGRHEIRFGRWMELDLQYIDNWSVALDLEIMFKTIPAALRGTGAS